MANITFTPNKDAYISSYYPNQNFGTDDFLFISRFESDEDVYRSLLQFNLNNLSNFIPPASTIMSGELELNVFRNESPIEGTSVKVFRLLGDFQENNITWNNQPLFSETEDGSKTIFPETFGSFTIDITNLAKGWYDGSIPNNGLILLGDETQNSLLAFRSKEYSDSSKWPKLKYIYTNGIINVFPNETINVPADSTTASSAIPLGPKKQATLFVENSLSTNLSIRIQIRNKGNQWADTESFILTTLGPNDAAALTTDAPAEEVRISLTNKDTENDTTVTVSATTKEN
ncbi:DNRLRE domain-containing protein [Clostridiisalibacter paucivorans]|uniref:DNRLRE domain-containing protein n=1 Tax=Clostridiisalibacter paucivorans TaxID=408753 RepID=UPI00047AD009|nr:DNRLRE domain-containing protein [Clostridiisalibacter paucivorans]